MFRFTIRDVLWLAVGLAVGWGLDGYRLRHALRAASQTQIVVFRHHPGLIDTEERMAARDRDAEAIVKTVNEGCDGYMYQGGLGSGYELSIHAGDLGTWKAAVDKLLVAGTLKYYDRWGLDRAGYGLVPVR